jgi:ankyrin repeat protein
MANGTLMRQEGLWRAADNGNLEDVRFFLNSGAIINTEGQTALFLAAANGHTDVTKLLLERGADPNLRSRGYLPLVIALEKEHWADALALLNAGADPDPHEQFPSPLGKLVKIQTPLEIAAPSGSIEIVAALLEKGARVSEGAVEFAIRGCNKPVVRALVASAPTALPRNAIIPSRCPDILRFVQDKP